MRNFKQFRQKWLSLGLSLTEADIHRFNDGFTSRYAGRLSKGEDLTFVWDYEIGCMQTGVKCFELDREYTNRIGLTITVRQRREDFLIVEYEGDLYEADYGREDGTEFLVVSDCMWWADYVPEDISEKFANE